MSLFASIQKASGGPSANYLQAGRHVGRIVRVNLREADPLQNIKAGFLIDIELLHSNRSDFNSEGGARKGDVCRANDSMKFMNTSLPRVKRTLAIAKSSKEERQILEDTLGLDNPTADEYTAECKRLCGPNQPLAGALITLQCTNHQNKTNGGTYTLFEPFFPTEDDLKNAGLI